MNVSKVSKPSASKSKYSSVSKYAVTTMQEKRDFGGKITLVPYGSTSFYTTETAAEKAAESLARGYVNSPSLKVVVGEMSEVVSAPAPAPIEVASL